MDLNPKNAQDFFSSLIPDLKEKLEYHEKLIRIYDPLVKEMVFKIGEKRAEKTILYKLHLFHETVASFLNVLILQYEDAAN